MSIVRHPLVLAGTCLLIAAGAVAQTPPSQPDSAANDTIRPVDAWLLLPGGAGLLAAYGLPGLRRGTDSPARTPVLAVTGVVRVEQTGQPVSGAMVSVDELGQRTSTDSLGRYRFSGLAYRSYTISVRMIGYIVERREVHAACSVEIQDEAGRVLTPSRCSPREEVLNFYLRPERHID